ncbi:MAG: nitronate monooxygenase [Oscillospiraceae bacterium]|jgi:enoyl-[acyl-carrier protein] reductase II|nr:nitronate monooxygenase [Oscillospiraceae bacterium]
MKTKLTELLGIEKPIIQGGMAWIADGALAAAVSNAGGAGIIAAGNAPVEYVRAEIHKARQLTDKPFGVNVMLMSPTAEDIAALCAEEQVAFVTTGAGNPGKYIEKWKSANVKVIPVVPSVALAKRMERAGADAVIGEGTESGGHIGEITTMCLVPMVADAVKIPVIAAGGIADKRGFNAALALGAVGVQCGTVFLAAEECNVHENYKKLVINAGDTDIAVTGRMTGHPCRGVKTAFARKLIQLETGAKEGWADEFEALTLGGLRKAAKDGDEKEGSFLCGGIAGLVKEIRSAQAIVDSIVG